MTQDSGSERPQRTVAELLAEYGAAGGEAPRRRRRRSDDDENSTPQTIIERVLSDSGKLLPIRDDQPPEPPRTGRRGGDHRPVGPQQPQSPRQQPQTPRQQPPPQPSGYAEPVRPPLGPPTGRGLPPTSPPMPVGPPPGQPMPSQPLPSQPLPSQPLPSQSLPAGPPAGQSMPPASRPGMPPVRPAGQPPQASRPAIKPVGPPTQQPLSRPGVSPAGRPPAGPPPMAARPPRPLDDDLATAINPPLPDDFDLRPYPQQSSMQARLGGPTEANTEEFPLVPPGRPGATQLVTPVGPQGPTTRRPPVAPPMESTQAHPGPYVDDYDTDGAGAVDDFNPSRDDFDEPDDFDSRPGRDRIDAIDADDDDEDVEPLSPGREWLLMGAQVGAGAIAGALVFLAFSWLWGFQPIIAVLAALVVIVGLVFGVRRWRRADDLQTTVLAILAGLVVTVSPAALLLVRR
jgi:hypothetical protein